MKKTSIAVLAAFLMVVWLSACTTYERQVVPFKMPAAYPKRHGRGGRDDRRQGL